MSVWPSTIVAMSPVSRGRKVKKTKKRGPTPPKRLVFAERAGVPLAPAMQTRRADWFDESIENVLDQVDVLLAAQRPRDLDQATAELVGAELHRVIHREHDHLWFNDWFSELIGAATGQSEARLRLLYGLAAIGSPGLREHAEAAIRQVDRLVRDRPRWLVQVPQVTATGEVWEMRDVYGSRFGFVAAYSYPDGSDSPVYLFDIEAGHFPISLVGAGVFDDVEQAAAAWRAQVGDAARNARPLPIESTERLLPLVHSGSNEDIVSGNESRAITDNWFRVHRRVHELGEALRKRGSAPPVAQSLFHNLDTEAMSKAFSDWYERRNGAAADLPAVEALAQDWVEGVLPESWHSVSPPRVEAQLAMFRDDWLPDDPLTGTAKALFPEWVRWNGEQASLPEHLIDRAVTAATSGAE
jgi:hypothetical protein